MRYELTSRSSTASHFHSRPIPDDPRPEVWCHEVTARAVVLGSAMADSVVDRAACDAAEAEVVRRRSGGGAVWLAPGEVVWVDVIVPAGAPGWTDDVRASMVWFGERVREAFASAGVAVDVHREAMVSTPWSGLVCFDGVAPGELLAGDAKVVGVSQRRVRRAARFQCCWYTRHDPAQLTALLASAVDPRSLRPVQTVDPAIARSIPDHLVAALDAAS